jgi:hypothetical protein
MLPGIIAAEIQLVQSDILLLQGPPKGQWGLFTPGTPQQPSALAFAFDSIVRIDYQHEWNLPTYPQEQGAFANYNKVQLPSNPKFRCTKGGANWDRSNFLTQVESAAASLTLFNFIGPDFFYTSVNIKLLRYARTGQEGKGLLSLDIELLEIRESVTPQFSNTAAPSGQNPANGGAVTPQAPAATPQTPGP